MTAPPADVHKDGGFARRHAMHEESPEARPTLPTPISSAGPEDPVMELLGASLPLSLIMDLVMPAGPHSRELLSTEPADDTSWLDDL
jgi:hypothetical protein